MTTQTAIAIDALPTASRHSANHPLAVIPASMTASRNRTGSFRSNFDKSGCSANDPEADIAESKLAF